MADAPFKIVNRGEIETDVFRQAMLNELQANAHKGPWTEIDASTATHEILYHAVKLALAMDEGDHPEAILEYAADVALSAMFAASASGALDVANIRPGHAEDYDAPWRSRLPGWKAETRRMTKQIMTGSPSPRRRPLHALKSIPRGIRRRLRS